MTAGEMLYVSEAAYRSLCEAVRLIDAETAGEEQLEVLWTEDRGNLEHLIEMWEAKRFR